MAAARTHILAILEEAGAGRERGKNGTHVSDYERYGEVHNDEKKDSARKTRSREPD